MRYPSIGIANMFKFLGNILTRYIGNIWFLTSFLRASHNLLCAPYLEPLSRADTSSLRLQLNQIVYWLPGRFPWLARLIGPVPLDTIKAQTFLTLIGIHGEHLPVLLPTIILPRTLSGPTVLLSLRDRRWWLLAAASGLSFPAWWHS